jgi:hypothetical protein
MDVIPDRIRNSVYSLSPTILFLFAMPQIGIFGWLIPVIGFPTTLFLIGLISLAGVFIIRHGLSLPKPPSVHTATKEIDDTSEVGLTESISEESIQESHVKSIDLVE